MASHSEPISSVSSWEPRSGDGTTLPVETSVGAVGVDEALLQAARLEPTNTAMTTMRMGGGTVLTT
jgi:hypothetical protein